MEINIFKQSLIISILGVAFATSSNANLIVNGDFEMTTLGNGPLTSWGSRKHLYESGDIQTWNENTDGTGSDNIELWTTRRSGNTFAELNSHGHPDGQVVGVDWNLFQNFDAEIGEEYELAFNYKARKRNTESFWVEVKNSTLSPIKMTDHTTNGWSSFSTVFVANADTLQLDFRTSTSNGTVGNFIDNVSVTAVPEPGALALLGLGLAALGFTRRKAKV
jgi:hypothetical protein